MEKRNKLIKSIFGLLVLTVVLTSGCLNSNEPIQKEQPTYEPKVINLHAKQIILDDDEIKDLFGVILTKNETIIPKSDKLPVYYGDAYNVNLLSGVSNLYDLKKSSSNNKYTISIGVYVFSTAKDAKYFESKAINSNRNIKVVKNIIDLGNTTGNLSSVISREPLSSWGDFEFMSYFADYFFSKSNNEDSEFSFHENGDREKIFDYVVQNDKTYLFDWNQVPGTDTKKFITFLRYKYKINWIETAIINKSDDNNIISAFNQGNSLIFYLKSGGTYLEINDKRQEESFSVASYLTSIKPDGTYGDIYDLHGVNYIHRYERSNFSLILNDEKTKVNLISPDGRFDEEFDVKKEDSTIDSLGETHYSTLKIYKQNKLKPDINVGDTVIIFSKNNIVVIMQSNPDFQIETIVRLAKKQDAKITRTLELLK